MSGMADRIEAGPAVQVSDRSDYRVLVVLPRAPPLWGREGGAAEAPAYSARMTARARLVGINHVALEVGDLEEALSFYGRIVEIGLRGRAPGMAFIEIGDQFIALSEGRTQPPDRARHFGLVVDDKEAVRAALREAGVEVTPGRGLNFRDPWGNQVQVVEYGDVQFTKAPGVLRGMGLEGLEKRPEALRELSEKGLG
jgi:predicted enzyme related to lactoylglutathione lyase